MDSTYVEEDEVEEEFSGDGVVAGLDGVSSSTYLGNQKDDNEKTIMYNAAPMGKELEDTVIARIPSAKLGQGYGMTEAGPVLSMCLAFTKDPLEIKSRSCGIVVSNAEIKITDPDTSVFLPGTNPVKFALEGNRLGKKKKKDKLTKSQVGYLNKYFGKIQQPETSNEGLVTKNVSEDHRDVNMGITEDLGNEDAIEETKNVIEEIGNETNIEEVKNESVNKENENANNIEEVDEENVDEEDENDNIQVLLSIMIPGLGRGLISL
ncbi:hypothetical protein GIB67_022549 [Kingdonia uniflora]|uniref:4-coumarate--CoA ligase n=1 Tax=Kingdonia uniflora TaxID=39325 RepID=A0A7J7L781_9MAGN|nr:hypothetical protein GIB67_022549 [Kingdonia uniflora]